MSAAAVPATPPTPEREIDGACLLSNLSHAIRRYVVLTKAQADTLALWIVHTHAIAAFYITPYLHITSAQKGCGKSLLLEFLDCLVAKPLRACYITPAALKSAVNDWHSTLLLDEIDQQMKGSKEMASTMRGLLNSGSKRGVPYISSVKKSDGNFKAEKFDCFCPKALAGIGHLWETVADRSLPIQLQRRLSTETIQRFRADDAAWHLTPLRKACEGWARANLEVIRRARPDVPAVNREFDLLEPLLAIADVAGGEWPERARQSLIEVCRGRAEANTNAMLELLADMREVFGDADRLPTEKLIDDLPMQPGMTALDGRKLARMLRDFGVRPRNLRIGGQVVRGYERADFEKVWARYLPPRPPDGPAAATCATTSINIGQSGNLASATEGPCSGNENGVSPNKDAACSGCSG